MSVPGALGHVKAYCNVKIIKVMLLLSSPAIPQALAFYDHHRQI